MHSECIKQINQPTLYGRSMKYWFYELLFSRHLYTTNKIIYFISVDMTIAAKENVDPDNIVIEALSEDR